MKKPILKRLREWWFEVTHVKCDYCNEPTETWYEAYMFDVPDYKGNCICMKCIDKLPHQERIVKV